MLSLLKGIVTDPEKRAILSWIGGAIVAVASGAFALVAFLSSIKEYQLQAAISLK